MSRIRASRSMGSLVYALIIAMMLPSMTAVLGQPELAGAPGERPVRAQATLTMLVFPLRDETGAGEDLERVVTQALARALEQLGGFDAQVFARNSPSAMRQVEEGVLRTEDVTPPYEPSRAVAVGHALDVDLVLVGSIMERSVDPDTNVVSLTISGTTYEIVANVDPDTGTPRAELQPYRPLFAVTGSSIERKIPHRGPVADLDAEAAYDAAEKAAGRITGVRVVEKKVKKRKFLDKWGTVLLVTLVAVGFAMAGSDGDGGGGEAAPPPTNLAKSMRNGGVELTWGPPLNPPRSILRYHVQRTVNSGPRDDVAGGFIDPSQFSVIDFDVQPGDRVAYFIRVMYEGNVYSQWVSFGVYIVPT